MHHTDRFTIDINIKLDLSSELFRLLERIIPVRMDPDDKKGLEHAAERLEKIAETPPA